MKNTMKNLRQSTMEFKSVYAIAFCGVLMALRVVLGFLEVTIGDTFRISFSALPVSLAGYMFGPWLGAITGAFGDIVTLIIKPTGPLNVGILIAKALSGFIMGLLLYKQPLSLKRNIVANVIVTVLCNIGIITVSLHMMYGTPYEVMLPVRLMTNAILLPFNIMLLYGAQKLVANIKLPHKLNIQK